MQSSVDIKILSRALLIFIPVLLLIALVTCNESGNNASEDNGSEQAGRNEIKPIHRDLEEIKEERILRAITIFSPTSYFLYKGQPMGFEYDLLTMLAKDLGLELEIVVADNLNELFTMLNEGKGDIVAHGMTITTSRKKQVTFTHHHFESHQVLVQRKPDNWRSMKLHEIDREIVRDPLELIGKTVHVRRNSSYYQRLLNLMQEIGGKINIETIPGNLATDEIIRMVVEGEIEYTVADNNIAAVNATYYPILDVKTDISFSQRMAWAIRKNSPDLLVAVNNWIDKMRERTDYYVIYNKYFKNKKLYKKRIKSEFHSETAGKISKYDEIVKKYAGRLGWDWRLLSSIIYQESRFDPEARSWAGGRGLMQLMPSTAKELGVNDSSDPEESIKGGTKYLGSLWNRWDLIPDSMQQIKFTLASYNCGYQHVVDAQKLASKNDDDPEIWDNAVEDWILKLSYPRFYNDEVVEYGYVRGIEPYEYVKEIFERYDHYKRFIPE
jgi:membrane-bound lytic murein transglycosylase F